MSFILLLNLKRRFIHNQRKAQNKFRVKNCQKFDRIIKLSIIVSPMPVKMRKRTMTYRFFKRTGDIILALIALILLSWLILLVTIINAILTKGHPFYIDHRKGKYGRDIGIIKFASMELDADTNPEKYLNKKQMKQWKKERKVDDDPRITKFGKILRKTSIDELPQLINILIGSISIVGPRPITERELVMNFTPEERDKLLSLKPGLTGNWAVNGRNSSEYKTHRRQELELEYIDKISFFFDIKIILKTFVVVFNMKNAR